MITREQKVRGEIYAHENGNIYRWNIVGSDIYLGNHQSTFHRGSAFENSNATRIATLQEKHWLLECDRLGHWIGRADANATFVSTIPEAIPSLWSIRITDENRTSLYAYRLAQGVRNTINEVEFPFMNVSGWGSDESSHSDLITTEQFVYYVINNQTASETPVVSEPIIITRPFQVNDRVRIIANTNNSINLVDDIGVITSGPNSVGNFQVQVDGRHNYGNWTRPYEMVLYIEELVLPARGASIEDILAYCKLKYPIGTRIISTYGSDGTVNDEFNINSSSEIMTGNIEGSSPSRLCLYTNGRYAEIITPILKQSTTQSTLSTKTYSIEQLQKVLTKEYDKSDVEDILKLIKTI